jgi:hypothetical protein
MLASVRRLAIVFAAMALAALAVPPLAGAADRLDTGIQDPLDPIFGETDPASAFGVVRSEGARFVRVPVAWSGIAPTRPQSPAEPSDPAYGWAWLDERVAAIEGAGLEPLLVLYSTPLWARTLRPNGQRSLVPVTADFADFARAAARRYDGTHLPQPRVRHWQMWNEPNVSTYFGAAVETPARYRRVANAGYDAIHAVAADNVVVAGGLSPFGGGGRLEPFTFMRSMLCMSDAAPPRPTCGARSSFDVWSHHPYTSGGPAHSAFDPRDASLGDLPEMRRLLRAAQRAHHIRSRAGVRFWVTEFGWDSNPPDPIAVRVKLHARWVAEALYRLWRNDVSLAVWFQLRDISPERRDWGSLGQGGLFYRTTDLYANERPKPAARAFRFPFVALPGRRTVTVWGRTPDSRRHDVEIERRAGGRWIRVVRVRANRHGIFQARPRGLNGQVLRARVGGSTSMSYRAVRSRDVAVNPFGGPPASR